MPPFKLTMANIESRRKNRILLPILISAGALLLAGVVVAAVLIIKHKNGTAAPGSDVSATDTPAPTDTPISTEFVTDAPSYTSEPEYTEAVPVRISDENSRVIIAMHAVQGSGEDGGLLETVSGSCSAYFVNNTDMPLYSAEFFVSGLRVVSATVNGYPARFSVSDDGVLTVPFMDELPLNGACSIFFEFRADILPGDSFSVPCFGEDMACEMCMEIDSDTPILFTGASPSSSENEGCFYYSLDKKTVRLLTAQFHF